jgi:hypothetical protein
LDNANWNRTNCNLPVAAESDRRMTRSPGLALLEDTICR